MANLTTAPRVSAPPAFRPLFHNSVACPRPCPARGARTVLLPPEPVESAAQLAQMPDHYFLAQGFTQAAKFHMLTVLSLVSRFWQWQLLWAVRILRQPARRRGARRKKKTRTT